MKEETEKKYSGMGQNDGMATLGIVVLAAGQSLRMGSNKLLLPIKRSGHDSHCLGHTLKQVEIFVEGVEFSCSLFCVYSSPEVAAFLEESSLKGPYEWTKLMNSTPEEGQSSSVLMGLKAVMAQNLDAICFVVADQPNMKAELFHRLARGLNGCVVNKKKELVPAEGAVPVVKGQWRNPIMIRKIYFNQLLTLAGDQGAKGIIQQLGIAMAEVEFENEQWFIDMDTPLAYESLKDE